MALQYTTVQKLKSDLKKVNQKRKATLQFECYINVCSIMCEDTLLCAGSCTKEQVFVSIRWVWLMPIFNFVWLLYLYIRALFGSSMEKTTWNESINPVSHCRCISVNYFICVTVERTKWRVCYLFVITILLPGNWTNFQLWLAVWKYVNVLFFVCHMSSFLFPNYNCSDWSRTWRASCLSLPWIQCILNPPEKNMVLNWRWP